MNQLIEDKLTLLPSSPGIYQMFDAGGNVIYVGKAISLKNRVRQYFYPAKKHPPKVAAMVSHVADFETILTSSETEALTLESNLIKQFRPRYNILLKDDKHFPYVRINIKQDFPRLEIVRKAKKDGAKYLGPYLSAIALRDALNVIRDQFPIRHCKKDIPKAIARNERPCLMYHIGKCCAPCSGNITKESYHHILEDVCAFLEGNITPIVQQLKKEMMEASDSLEFEKAAQIRDRIAAIESISEKQVAISTKHTFQDVFALCAVAGRFMIFSLFIRAGKLIGTERFSMQADDEDPQLIISSFLKQYYAESPDFPSEILLHQSTLDSVEISNWLSSLAGHKVTIQTPQRGDKRQLVELAYKNGMDVLQKEMILKQKKDERNQVALTALCEALHLTTLPERIECFDNSHIQGNQTVSSMVVFTNGLPDKTQYRRFRIRSVSDGDDYAAMREVLTRRFSHTAENDKKFTSLPDLLIIDGGKGQLNIALEVIKEFSLDYIPLIGIAEKQETIYLPDQDEPIALAANHPALQLIQRIRDEAHRFAITYHRGLRQRDMLFSVLDEIPGVGEKRKRALFQTFTSLEAIKQASLEEISAVSSITAPVAQAIYNHFHAE